MDNETIAVKMWHYLFGTGMVTLSSFILSLRCLSTRSNISRNTSISVLNCLDKQTCLEINVAYKEVEWNFEYWLNLHHGNEKLHDGLDASEYKLYEWMTEVVKVSFTGLVVV